MNELLLKVSLDNPVYGLILKLTYIYGRNISDVLSLIMSDLDFDRDRIKFRMSKSNLVLPLVDDVRSDLVYYVNGLPEDYGYGELLFAPVMVDEDFDVNVLTKRINYYLNVKIGEWNRESSGFKFSKVTTKDFKVLRGQHLVLDGVPLDMVHKLFNNYNLGDSRDFIDYEDIAIECGFDSLDSVIGSFTDLNLFEDRSKDVEDIFVVFDRDENYCVVEFVDNGLVIHEASSVSDRLAGLDVNRIYDEVKCLGVGEYKFVEGFKFLR